MTALPRREFIISCASAAAALALPGAARGATGEPGQYYERLARGRVRCQLCPNRCVLADGERGACRARINCGGSLRTLAHANPAILRVDPVEKWPLYHFRPGSRLLALGTGGCNLSCTYCQNWQLSQRRPDSLQSFNLPPTRAPEKCEKYGVSGVGFAYTEPVTAIEYSLAVAAQAREAGLTAVAGTALVCEPGPARDLGRGFDALAVTLKAGSESTHRTLTGMPLSPVLRNLELVRGRGAWLEVVTLVVPTINDSDHEIRTIARFVAQHLGRDVPLHLDRFFPEYKLRNLPFTPLSTLVRAREIALAEGLRFAYIGNAPGHAGQNTLCPVCGTRLHLRIGTDLLENKLGSSGVCQDCGQEIAGVWV